MKLLIKHKKHFLYLVLLILIVLSFPGKFSTIQEKLFLRSANTFIDEADIQLLDSFVRMTELKEIFNAISNSEETSGLVVSDLINPMSDGADFSYFLIFASSIIVNLLKVLLYLSREFGSYFLDGYLLLLMVKLLFKIDILRRYLHLFSILAFSFLISIPVSITGSGLISSFYFQEAREVFESKTNEYMFELEENLQTAEKNELITREGWPPVIVAVQSKNSIFPYLAAVPIKIKTSSSIENTAIKDILIKMQEYAVVLPELFFKIGATWLLQVTMIPLAIMVALYYIFYYLFHLLFRPESLVRFKKLANRFIHSG